MTDDRHALPATPSPPPLVVLYTNHRGETAMRQIIPLGCPFWGETSWHREPQWLMKAFDVEKKAIRVFALDAMVRKPASPSAALDQPLAQSDNLRRQETDEASAQRAAPGSVSLADSNLSPGTEHTAHRQGVAITPTTLGVTVVANNGHTIWYRRKGEQTVLATSLERFREIVTPDK